MQVSIPTGIRTDTDGEPNTAFYVARAHQQRNREIRALLRAGLDSLRRVIARLRTPPSTRLIHHG